MILGLVNFQNHDTGRMSSITQVLHITTWIFFLFRLPYRFIRLPEEVKEMIMTDINDLVKEFWRISSDGTVEASFFAMRCLFEILQTCFHDLEVCFVSVFVTAVDLADKIYRSRIPGIIPPSPTLTTVSEPNLRYCFMGIERCLISHFLNPKIWGDILRYLPGVVVQKYMSKQGMADLYRINLDLLERHIISTIDPLRPLRAFPNFNYRLNTYLSGSLQDRDRSQLYYCDPMLQHISICRHFLSFLDGSNALVLQS